MITYVSEALLYVAFAILTGALALKVVPASKRPAIEVPNGILVACAAGIPVFSFITLHELTVLYAEQFELSYFMMLKSMILDINFGKAWLWTAIGSIGILMLLTLKAFRTDKHAPKVALVVALLLIVWLGYASHASALYGFKGLVAHSLHFMAVSVWIGILIVVGWFSKNDDNWGAFLRWFSPVAIIAVIVTLIAGLLLMSFIVPEYVTSWILPYGQLLLMKHLFILPLLLFAYTNGFLYKRLEAKQKGFNPRRWLRVESIFALFVLAATAVMGQQAPPHTVKETLQYVSPSPLFTWLYKQPFSPDITLSFTFKMEGVLMLAAAAIMAAGVLQMYRANKPMPAFAMGLLTAVFGYFAIMFSIA